MVVIVIMIAIRTAFSTQMVLTLLTIIHLRLSLADRKPSNILYQMLPPNQVINYYLPAMNTSDHDHLLKVPTPILFVQADFGVTDTSPVIHLVTVASIIKMIMLFPFGEINAYRIPDISEAQHIITQYMYDFGYSDYQSTERAIDEHTATLLNKTFWRILEPYEIKYIPDLPDAYYPLKAIARPAIP